MDLVGTELPHAAGGYGTGAYWVIGLATAAAFYGCLLAHEPAHAVVARRAGITVERIVLWLYGGVSRLKGDPAGPDTELRVAVAGPAASLALGAVFSSSADSRASRWGRRCSLRRRVARVVAPPTDIAPAVVFLASDAAGYITGQTLSVSGGLTMS